LFKSLFYSQDIYHLKNPKIIFLATHGLDSVKDTYIIFQKINGIA